MSPHLSETIRISDANLKGIAGIFTRCGLKNIKKGEVLKFDNTTDLSADMVLLKVRLALLRLSTVETCSLSPDS